MLKYFILVCLIYLSNGQDDFYRQNWIKLFQTSKTWFKISGNNYINIIENSEMKNNLSVNCANKLIMMINRVSQEEWAAKSKLQTSLIIYD